MDHLVAKALIQILNTQALSSLASQIVDILRSHMLQSYSWYLLKSSPQSTPALAQKRGFGKYEVKLNVSRDMGEKTPRRNKIVTQGGGLLSEDSVVTKG